MVHQHQDSAGGGHCSCDLLQLARANERGGIRTVAPLDKFSGNLRARRGRELAELRSDSSVVAGATAESSDLRTASRAITALGGSSRSRSARERWRNSTATRKARSGLSRPVMIPADSRRREYCPGID